MDRRTTLSLESLSRLKIIKMKIVFQHKSDNDCISILFGCFSYCKMRLVILCNLLVQFSVPARPNMVVCDSGTLQFRSGKSGYTMSSEDLEVTFAF